MRVSPAKTLRQALVVAGALLLAGCSRSLLTAPSTGTTSASTNERGIAQAPPPSNLLGGVLSTVDKVLNWTTVVQRLVLTNQAAVVAGHRWSLDFDKGSLTSDALITIQDYDPDILDVQFGPHGTKFPVPVTLIVDFSNTAADPGAVQYNGSVPVLYWLNDRTNTWEEVPGSTDWAHKKLIVRLEHFSRYVVGGKAGWKQAPGREND
jgi:hypothetical protein